MKILHVHSANLKIFEDAFAGTGCHINGSRDLDYLLKSIPRFNCRDVMGLVVFRDNLTAKTLKLIKSFDELFVFSPKPIIVACDNAHQLFKENKIVVRNSPLFLIDTVDGTMSDTDLNRIMTTLSCFAGSVYYLDDVEKPYKTLKNKAEKVARDAKRLVDDVLSELLLLGGK